MFNFPWTNFHELNLDWILSAVKEAKEVFDNGRADIDHAVETADEAKEIATQAAEATIADNSISTNKLQNGAVTHTKLASNSVTTNNIVDRTIIGNDIAENTIESYNIKNGTIIGADIAENTVEQTNLAVAVQNKLNAPAIVTTASYLDGKVMQYVNNKVVEISIAGAIAAPTGEQTIITTISDYRPPRTCFGICVVEGGVSNKYCLATVATNGQVIIYNYSGTNAQYIFGTITYITT